MRTREEIVADCEKRFHELRAEKDRLDNDPAIQYPCRECCFYSKRGDNGVWWGNDYPHKHTCTEPLVKGFRKWGVRIVRNADGPMPCGPEKALWQRRKLRQRICDFLFECLS